MFSIEAFSALPFSSLGGEFKDGASTLSATATINAGPSFIRASDISLASQATLVSEASFILSSLTSLQASSEVTFRGTLSKTISSSIVGTASLDSQGRLIIDGAKALSISSEINPDGELVIGGISVLESSSTITAGGSLLTTNSSNLKGQGSLTANNSLILSIGSDFESQATLEAITAVDGAGKAFLSTSSQIVANNSMILNGGYSPGSFSEGFNGAFDIVNIPLLIAGQGSLDASIFNLYSTTSLLAGQSTLTGVGVVDLAGSTNLSGQGTLDPYGSSVLLSEIEFVSQASLVANPSLIINGAYSTGSFSQAFNNSFDIVNKHIFFGGEGSVIGELSEGGGELLGSASLEVSSTLTGIGSISLTSQGIDGSLSSQGTLVSNLTNSVEFSEGVSLLSSSSTLSAAGSLLSLSSSSISGSATLTGNIETQTFSASLASSSTITGNGVLVGRTEVVNFPLYIHRLQKVTLQSLSSLTSIGGESASLVLFDSNISRQQTFSLSKLSTGLYSLLEQKSLCEFDLNLVTAQSFSLNVHSINNIDSYLEYDSIFNMNLDQSTEFMTEIDTVFEVAL